MASREMAESVEKLEEEGVTHVLNCAEGRGFGHCPALAHLYQAHGIAYRCPSHAASLISQTQWSQLSGA